jgi:hypothetical protein
MIVKKKSIHYVDEKDKRESSMIASQNDKAESLHSYEGDDAEYKLYNLLRGHTSLMIAEGSDSSEDDEEEGEESEKEEESSSSVPEWASSSTEPQWGSTVSNPPTWGNNLISNIREEEIANEWRDKGRSLNRRSRDEEISRGNSPPPKFEEDNLFTEGNSRRRVKPIYRPKEDITDKQESREWNSVDEFTNGRLDSSMRRKRSEGKERDNSPPSKMKKNDSHLSSGAGHSKWGFNCHHNHGKEKKDESSHEENDESSSEENDAEEYSSEDDEGNEPEKENEGKDESDSDDEGTLGQIFREIRNGTFDPKKRRRRFEEQSLPKSGRVVERNPSYLEDDDGIDRAARRVCAMSTTEALHRLTRNEKDERNEEDEWLIIKVSRKQKNKYFMVDYCDGDTEDEFHWLEGPYLQKDWTIRDLMEQKTFPRCRFVRRRQGRAEFRDDEVLDKRDIDGNLLPEFRPRPTSQPPPSLCFLCGSLLPEFRPRPTPPPPPSLCQICHREIMEMKDSDDEAGSSLRKPKKNHLSDDKKSTSMMVKQAKTKEEAPLHDMTCIGIDTCSARSISCKKEDFLDLQIIEGEDDHLRGIGGTNGVAGRGCLVFYVKDSEGKMKAILEPKGFYLENPPAQFRIIGQQRMKHKGLCATQDHDDAGTDILKCKRSGTILPLTEGRGLLLLQTISYTPSAELKDQLRNLCTNSDATTVSYLTLWTSMRS